MNGSIAPARPGDQEAVLALYRSLMGTPGCTWEEGYPNAWFVEQDMARGSLYCLRGEDGALLGAASLTEVEEDLAALPFWIPHPHGSCELSRVAVRLEHQGRGLAKALVGHLLADAARRGCGSVRLLVSPENPAALALYRGLGFVTMGEAVLYGCRWFCQERLL